MNRNRIPFFLLVASLIFSQTACLKTRAQIKGEKEPDQAEEQSGDDAKSTKGHYALEEMKNELTRISGKVEELDHTQRTQSLPEFKETLTRLDTRVAELEKNQVLIMSELKELKDQKEAQAKEAASKPADLMSEANQLLANRKCDEAAEKYRLVLNKSPSGKDAAEVHFGMGEALYCSKDYKKAIVQFSKVQESFAKSARIPQALYKIGLAFQHLNMPKESKGFFSELIERFPKSAEAKKARAKVKE